MRERSLDSVDIAEVVSSMVEVQTPYRSLGEALESEGFEFTHNITERGGALLFFLHARSDFLTHRNSDTITLLLKNNGISHAIGYDTQKPQFEGKLAKIEVPQFENSVILTFNASGKGSGTKVTLSTRSTIKIS